MNEALSSDQQITVSPHELPAELQSLPYHLIQRELLAETRRRNNASNQLEKCQAYIARQATAGSGDTV